MTEHAGPYAAERARLRALPRQRPPDIAPGSLEPSVVLGAPLAYVIMRAMHALLGS